MRVVRWAFVAVLVIGTAFGLSRLLGGKDRQADTFADEGGLESSLQALAENSNRDVPGRDLKTVPRYPQSERIFYGRQRMSRGGGEAFLVIYQCQGSLRAVSAFYEAELPKYGWVLAVKDENFLHMDFVRHDARGFDLPMVQLQFRPVSDGETMVSIVAMDDT